MPALSFDEVLRKELESIQSSRTAHGDTRDVRDGLLGLAISGGRKRSVAFSLGVLQALAHAGLLERLDYLSSTGSGSYIAGWLSAWLFREQPAEVARKLGTPEAVNADAGPLRTLKEATDSTVTRDPVAGYKAELVWIRNTLLNLVMLATMIGAFLLLCDAAFDAVTNSVNRYFGYFRPFLSAAIFGASLVFLRWFVLLTGKTDGRATAATRRLLWASIFCAPVSAAFVSFPFTWLAPAACLAVFCCIAWWPRSLSIAGWAGHFLASAAVGIAGGWLVVVLEGNITLLRVDPGSEFFPPFVMFVLIAATGFYLFLTAATSRPMRERARMFCQGLFGASVGWLTVVLSWTLGSEFTHYHLTLTVSVLAVGGLLTGLLLRFSARAATSRLLAVLNRLAPYVFIVGFTVSVAISLGPFVEPSDLRGDLREVTVAVGLLAAGLLLMWRAGPNEFTMYNYDRSRLNRYCSGLGVGRDEEILLAGLERNHPYPLFCAALSPTGPYQGGGASFVLAPLFSGSGAWRPTADLGGGTTLAGAMAISGPLRPEPLRPASRASALLLTVFDMRNGRLIGNPRREDTWRTVAPRAGAGYALLESLVDSAAEPAYVRPTEGEEFDKLGIYELVRRRCRFIIACDASSDPGYVFEALGDTIRRCRTELGAEIEFDLAPLARSMNLSRQHSQIATIRYSPEEAGLILYIKPSLTGDEPADIVQYAASSPMFPASDMSGRFDEAAFESYRLLGQHILTPLLATDAGERDVADMSLDEIFRKLRRRLQPGFQDSGTASPAPAVSDDELPLELVKEIASGECVLCAGWGLGAQAGLPDWRTFLDGLLKMARERGLVDAQTSAALAASLEAGESEAVADELAHQIPMDVAAEYVNSLLRGHAPSRAHQLLGSMPFLGVLNTAIDPLLLSAFSSRGERLTTASDAAELAPALHSKAFFNINVSGDLATPHSVAYSMNGFKALLAANPSFRPFLTTLFVRYTFVFVGMSIDGIRDFLETLEVPGTPESRHYAILPRLGDRDRVKLRYLERSWNIQSVEFNPQFKFAGLPALLERLVEKVGAQAPKTSGAMLLRNLRLTNIGPFDSLELKLTPGWNVLLGNNGVGKTIVLRAIAAALCGDKADPQALSRLLKTGTDTGEIVLNDSGADAAAEHGRRYAVRLTRDAATGKVSVVSATLSPLTYDRWLVLGFPALRAIPWERPGGPVKMKAATPQPADVQPILRGQPDNRLNDLKQWLVNLDYAAKSEASPSPSRKLFGSFFDIMQALTPDLRMKFHSIDSKSMEITIETDGGLVPIETISQGTGSVMCWIGTLIERISEASAGSDDSRISSMVLIDEIDAHMHPQWQRMFVSAFRAHFPEVQIIATTHSPLMLGSLNPDELWYLRRVPVTSEIYGLVSLTTSADGSVEALIHGQEDNDVEEGQVPAKAEERRYRIPPNAVLRVHQDDVVEKGEALTQNVVLIAAERINVDVSGWRADQILTSPFFELETTRDPVTAKRLQDYAQLAIAPDAAPQDIAEVAGQLQVSVPSSQETEAARRAYQLINAFAAEKIKELPEKERQRVLDEVKLQLTESITGTRPTA